MHMQKRRFTNGRATQRMAAAGLGVRPSHSLVVSSRADPASILGVAERGLAAYLQQMAAICFVQPNLLHATVTGNSTNLACV